MNYITSRHVYNSGKIASLPLQEKEKKGAFQSKVNNIENKYLSIKGYHITKQYAENNNQTGRKIFQNITFVKKITDNKESNYKCAEIKIKEKNFNI